MNTFTLAPQHRHLVETANNIKLSGERLPEYLDQSLALLGAASHIADNGDPSGGYYTRSILKVVSDRLGNLYMCLLGEDPQEWGFEISEEGGGEA